MKVYNFRTKEIDGRKRVSADVLWETAERPTEEIYFEVDQEFSNDISCNPDAFYLATLFPALYYGEERYEIEKEICPVLYQGSKDALACLKHWYYEDKISKPIHLEVNIRSSIEEKKESRNSACFFTGGIDSYATLFDNWSTYPKEHPGHINDVILAFGLDQEDPEKFELVLSFLKQTVEELDLNLIPVYTNIYLKYRKHDASKNFYYWRYEYQGAALASIAHILSNRLQAISIGATYDFRNLGPFGSHPLLDPNYSSTSLQVRHDGLRYSRLEKAEIFIQNSSNANNLRVCNRFSRYEPGNLNCGRCEKCMRTMLEFLVLGKLQDTDIFPVNDITEGMVIKHAIIENDYNASCYQELIEPLKEINRMDLVDAVKTSLKRYNKKDDLFISAISRLNKKIVEEENTYLSFFKKIDKYVLNGTLRKIFLKLKNKNAIRNK